jgi:nitronate monooxygenase
MGLHSGGTLAAAVSKAGALGSFGGLHPQKGPDWLLAEVAYIRMQTERPFAIGFINDFIPRVPSLFDAALEAKRSHLCRVDEAARPSGDGDRHGSIRRVCERRSPRCRRRAYDR